MVQTGILAMFARSPIRPIQRHMEKAHECAKLLLPFFDAVIKQDWEQAAQLRQTLIQNEHAADDLKMDLRLHLPKNLFLPVPRHDLLELLDKQEKIANIAKDISGIVLGRKMKIPDPIREQFIEFLKTSIHASSQAKKAINELDELLESGFRGKEVTFVNEMIKELNHIEKQTDELQITLRQALFTIETQLSPIDAIFLYKIIDWIGALANCAQNAGYRLRMLTAG